MIAVATLVYYRPLSERICLLDPSDSTHTSIYSLHDPRTSYTRPFIHIPLHSQRGGKGGTISTYSYYSIAFHRYPCQDVNKSILRRFKGSYSQNEARNNATFGPSFLFKLFLGNSHPSKIILTQ